MKDAELALSQEKVSQSLRKALRNKSEWQGVGHLANHTCCEEHENVFFEIITVHATEEDEDGIDLETAKPEVAAILRAKRAIQPGEFLRASYSDKSKDLQRMFQCTCCKHVGP